MARILITSGPTRQYLDPVRYLTNASSGRMGSALAASALRAGHQVTVVSGPVSISYPDEAHVVTIRTTQEMLDAVQRLFPEYDGLIGAAAPCDYMPQHIRTEKIAKDGRPLQLELIETPDVVATAAASKRSNQWVVGFALETEDQHFRAIVKMQRKCCDLMVSNGPSAIDSEWNDVEILAADGSTLAQVAGSKSDVADAIIMAVQSLILPASGKH
ncbi:MAG: phosphopantothenoylcysteine decarboxylase [Pirellulaceae bacterium]|nr:phosphopantothenoylcysteine decarboxylase [Pirellulaceae bacterium]